MKHLSQIKAGIHSTEPECLRQPSSLLIPAVCLLVYDQSAYRANPGRVDGCILRCPDRHEAERGCLRARQIPIPSAQEGSGKRWLSLHYEPGKLFVLKGLTIS